VHAVVIVPGLQRGLTSKEGDSSVSIFDTRTFKTIKKLSVPNGPDFIFYDSQSKQLLVCHEVAEAISVIDPNKGEITGKIDLCGGTEAAVMNHRGTGFVNLEAQAHT